MFVAGPVIWSVHFMVIYLVTEAGCSTEGTGFSAFNPPVPAVVTLAATAVAAVACIGVAWWCWRQWRSVCEESVGRADHPGNGSHERYAGEVLPLGGFLMALLGLLTVLFVGLPALVLPSC